MIKHNYNCDKCEYTVKVDTNLYHHTEVSHDDQNNAQNTAIVAY